MFETPLTIMGRIVTTPTKRPAGGSSVVSFRVASNARKFGAEGWQDSRSLFMTVSCWGKLGTNVLASLGRGDAVVVVGNIHTNEYDDREGVHRSATELTATAVGPDLNQYVAALSRIVPREQPQGAEDAAPSAEQEPDRVPPFPDEYAGAEAVVSETVTV